MEKIIKGINKLNEIVKRKLLGLREFEAADINSRLIGDKKKILNVGCLWGRDYYFLNLLGKEVINFDLGDQKLPNMVIGDISKKTKFKDNEFDAVLMGEVIEHLFDDIIALKEIRRILKKDGKLVLTVPYYDDGENHARIHSPKTIKRLLEHSGFRIRKNIFRGGLINIPFIFSGIARILGKISTKLQIKYLKKISSIDYYLGNTFNLSGGAYILAERGREIDFVEKNRRGFIKNG